jgi:filamentous hemagglutinin family protein
MNNLRKISKKLIFRKYLIYFLIYSIILNTSLPSVFALQAGDVINSTGVISTSWGNNTIINTNHGAIINWNNFNTSSSQSVTFNQYKNGSLNSSSSVLNRISSGNIPTQFDGVLNANGSVFIINPAGIIFGKGSSINANQLIASSLDISNSNFLNENYEFIAGKDNIGSVINNGSITAAEGIALLGRKVFNTGMIATGREGFVVMAAGDKVVLKEPSSSIIVQVKSVTLPDSKNAENIGSVINSTRGQIISPAGTIVLAAGDIFTLAMELDSKAARIVDGIGVVEQKGIIHADGINGDGGNINLLAGREIVLNEGSFTTANAGTNGAGGLVVLYSNGTTIVNEDALITAMGGTVSGNGGFIEISGNHFGISGEINAAATYGLPGTLLIDPVNVIIANGGNKNQLDTWYEESIEHHSQSGMNVLIEAENSITVQNILDDEITGGSGSITLRTTNPDGSIYFTDKADKISNTLGEVVIKSKGDGYINNLITNQNFFSGKDKSNQITITTRSYNDKNRSRSCESAEEGKNTSKTISINCNDDHNKKPDCEKPDYPKPDCPKPKCPKPDCPDIPDDPPVCPPDEPPSPEDPKDHHRPHGQKSQTFLMPVAPLNNEVEFEYSDCTALINWTSRELGTDTKTMQISITSNLTSIKDMEPCEMCARLKRAAAVLQDAEGTYTAALAQVINEYASDAAPPSSERMALIANAIASNIDEGSHYAASGKYLDALAEYIGILNNEMNYSAEESIMFAADNYISRLEVIENKNVADFLAAKLAALGG